VLADRVPRRTMNNINWSIGLEVTLSVLGFHDINTPDDRRADLTGPTSIRAGSPASVVDLVPRCCWAS